MTRSRTRSGADLPEISPEGALAGRAFSIVLIASAIGLVVVSWGDLWVRCGELAGPCVAHAAAAMILDLLSALAVAWAAAILIRIRRRPVHAEGSSRYAWALGVLFAAGLVLTAARIPAFTCARGRFDDLLELCMHPPGTSTPTRWFLAKGAVVAAGLVGGAVIAARPRWIRVAIPAAVLAWGAGAGWSAVTAFLRP